MAYYTANKYWTEGVVPDQSLRGEIKTNVITGTIPKPSSGNLAANDIIGLIKLPPWHEMASILFEFGQDDTTAWAAQIGGSTKKPGASDQALDKAWQTLTWAAKETYVLTPAASADDSILRSSDHVGEWRELVFKVTTVPAAIVPATSIESLSFTAVLHWYNRKPKR